MKLEIGTKFKVTKDIYYVIEDSIDEGSYLTLEEMMNSFGKVLVKDDVYEVIEEDDEQYLLCVEGSWEGETNDGWFVVEEMIEKGALTLIK